MRLFRRDRRFAWLALSALAMQLIVSFGHVHTHGAYAAAAYADGCSSTAQSQCPAHDDDDEQHCPICWAVSLAGAMVLPQPQVITGPIELARTFEHRPAVVSLHGSETVKFQARAPPPAPMTA
jgi:hypothetical protein